MTCEKIFMDDVLDFDQTFQKCEGKEHEQFQENMPFWTVADNQ